MNSNNSISNSLFFRSIILTVFIFIASITAFISYWRAEKQIDHANTIRFNSHILADELRQSSDDLTRMARTYVVTGQPIYKKHYQEILDIRSGITGRPVDYENIYWDLVLKDDLRPHSKMAAKPLIDRMKDAGFTEAEFALLTEAHNKSNQLTKTELEAMSLIDSLKLEKQQSTARSNQAKAINMLHDDFYHLAKFKIMKPISEFNERIDKRTLKMVSDAEEFAYIMRLIFILISLLLIFALLNSYRRLRQILGCSVDELFLFIKKLGQGDFKYFRQLEKPIKKENILNWLYETQKSLEEISSLKESKELLLKNSEEKFRKITQSAQDAIIMIGPRGEIVEWNHAAEKMFGYTVNEVMGQEIHPLLAPSHQHIQINKGFQHFIETGTGPLIGKVSEAIAIRKNKDEFPVEASIAGILIDQKWHAIGIFRDISERKATEKLIKKTVADAVTANKAKTSFLANMSHEIRTPLNSIIGIMDVLIESKLDNEQQRLIHIASTAGQNLLHLINDILDLSRIESGTITLETIPFYLTKLVETCLAIFEQRARDKNIALEYFIASDVPNHLLGDPTRIRQILINLIGNALKFSERGKIIVEVTKFLNNEPSDYLLFSVKDQGIGIPEDKIDLLFKNFSQTDSSISRKFGGSGLGLAISKKLVEIMNGNIWVESTLNKGSTFLFTAKLPAISKTASTGRLNSIRVLICSKDSNFLSEVSTMLRSENAIVTETKSEDEAIAKIINTKDSPYNIIISQCSGLKKDACEFVKEIRKIENIVLPTKFLSAGCIDCKIKNTGLMLGINCEFKLPIKKEDLIRGIEGYGSIDKNNLPVQSSVVSKPLHILLADDSKDNRALIEIFLKGLPHTLWQVENGLEAVERFKKQKFDIVLMDVQMPEMDGYMATSIIRNWELEVGRPQTTILALTANAFDEDIQASINAGCTEHITKPIKKIKLLELLDKYSRS